MPLFADETLWMWRMTLGLKLLSRVPGVR